MQRIEGLSVRECAPLREYTRFGLGGPAEILADASTEDALASAIAQLEANSVPYVVIGGGSNLVVSDEGFDGVVLRYTNAAIARDGTQLVAGAGANLQDVVDRSIVEGLAGMHTMTGIPGWVGGAVYGNAGAYGRSIHQNVTAVRFFDGKRVGELRNAECGFRYRHSVFKDRKDWIVLGMRVELLEANADELHTKASEILNVRNAKYPPSMMCAGSIFKNVIFEELPQRVQGRVAPAVVREGKVPSAWFLEQIGAKGRVNGGIRVADYHANLIYNSGNGTAAQVRELVDDLKARVEAEFGFAIEEEVQYVGDF